MSTRRLSVARADLARALADVTVGLRKGKSGIVRFDFDGSDLEIAGPGAATAIRASGSWPGSVRADAGMMKALGLRLPAGDPLLLEIADRRLRIGGFSLAVEILDIAPPAIFLPIDADAPAILAAVERHGLARVKGIAAPIAIEKANRALAAAVANALLSLRPFGVTQGELEEVARRGLRRRAGLEP